LSLVWFLGLVSILLVPNDYLAVAAEAGIVSDDLGQQQQPADKQC
jgi:hypothetical protein